MGDNLSPFMGRRPATLRLVSNEPTPQHGHEPAPSGCGCTSVGQWGIDVYAVWMTCALDGREHAVREGDFSAGSETGRYFAACERLLAPRALSAPSGLRCMVCVATVGECEKGVGSGRPTPRRRCWPRWFGGSHGERHRY